MCHLHVVLRALMFVHHVVVAGAIFIKGLRIALLDVLHLVAGALHPVADHCATNQTDHGGQRTAAAVANCVADCPARHSAQQCAAA